MNPPIVRPLGYRVYGRGSCWNLHRSVRASTSGCPILLYRCERIPSSVKIRSGDEYVASLRDGRNVWLDGERIADVGSHPALNATVTGFAKYYDLVNDPRFEDVLRIKSPGTGDRVSVFLDLPRSRGDLVRRRTAVEFVLRESGGLVTRLPDFAQALLVGFWDVKEGHAVEARAFAANIERWFDRMEESDAMLAPTFNDPQIDRGKGLSAQGALRIVEKPSGGVVVRGARALATDAPFANECLCLRKPVPPDAADFCLDFIVPLNSEGLTMICRPSLGRSPAPGGDGRPTGYDELDAMLIFDDVLVPDGNIFLLGRPDLVNKTWGRITVLSLYHDHIRATVKAELLLGIASLIVEYIGTSRFSAVMEDLTELIEYVETLRALAVAAEAECTVTPAGLALPNRFILDVARFHHHRYYPRVLGVIRSLSGQSLVTSLTGRYFDQAEILPQIERYFGGNGVSAQDKAKLFRLA